MGAKRRFLKTSEVAKILGVDQRTVERMVKEMRLIGFKIGHEYRVLGSEVWRMRYFMKRSLR